MTVDFRDYFWGEKHNGFDVLYHNMKYGYVAAKELAEFFRERSVVEETHSKLLSKLARQASSSCSLGTFGPLWTVLRVTSEKLASLHGQMVSQLQDLVKDVQRYYEEQHKQHKQVKEEEAPTLEVVNGLQHTTVALMKAHDTYVTRCIELERLRREASPKDLDKAEAKAKKACDEYRQLVEKHGTVRDDFERRMATACQHFQGLEEGHLKHMKEFLAGYARVMESNHALIGQVHMEFRQQCDSLDVESLLRQFTMSKQTGSEKPGPVTFEEPEIGLQLTPTSTAAPGSTPDGTPQSSGGEPLVDVSTPNGPYVPPPLPVVTESGKAQPTKKEGFLRTKWERQKEKRKRKKEMNTNKDNLAASGEMVRSSQGKPCPPPTFQPENSSSPLESVTRRLSIEQPRAADDDSCASVGSLSSMPVTVTTREPKETANQSVEIDDEGYTVRPTDHHKENDRDSFYSSSDGDSDDEDREKRIHIEIKPLSNGTPMSASVDELRATIGSLALSPIPQHSNRRPEILHFRHKTRRAYNSATSTPDEAPKRTTNHSKSSAGGGSAGDSDVLSLFPTDSNTSTPTAKLPSPLSLGPNDSSATASSTATTASAPWDRYAALSELFSDKAVSDSSTETTKSGGEPNEPVVTPTGLLPSAVFPPGPTLPRPPSRRSEAARGRMSPLPMSRTESVGSLSNDFKTTPMPLGSSRGPSPLTIGMCDTIPLAVAFQEVVHARFCGTDESKCQVKLLGDMKVSFPAGIVSVLANNPSPAALTFRVSGTSRFDNILPNKNLVSLDPIQSTGDRCVYEFNMGMLTALLRKQHEQTPSASYFNIDILKYHIRAGPGARSAPLHLVAYWKCQSDTTDLKVDYEYNSKALVPSLPTAQGLTPLTGVCMGIQVDGGVSGVQAKPSCVWNSETQRATWRLPEALGCNARGGSLLARFALKEGPSNPKPLEVRFACEGASLSGAGFELVGAGYRVSLVKKQVMSGKYICEP
ncbi:F-BAR domain only protein 2-like isoform X2 [Ornithodoros turicata]|uniref:F-BAR domain only protein 2-like isoform X2 n=1 Tax=Ornithodoros turicata TaxID=34597 RepID=UPI003138BAA0